MEENSGLNAAEQAFFDNGGATDPESGDEATSETHQGESQKETSSGEEKTQAPEAATPPAPEPKQEKEKTVPLAALHQARMEIKEIRERNAKMEQMFQKLVEQKQQAEQPQIPAVDVDPLAHFSMRNQQLEQSIQKLTQTQQQWEQQQAQQAQETQFQRQITALESEFKRSNPDYDDATIYLKTQIANDLQERGASNEEIHASINSQMRTMVIQASNAGINPAQLAYYMAQAKGYKSKTAAPPQNIESTQQELAQESAAKIAQINKGQQAAKSLSSTGGKSKPELTLEAMAEMDDAELEKHWGQIKKLM